MGFLSWEGRRHSRVTFFGPSLTEKNMIEARARKISGEFLVTVGGRGREMRVTLVHTHVCARRWALAEPEGLHCRLRVTEPERSIDPLLLTEPD